MMMSSGIFPHFGISQSCYRLFLIIYLDLLEYELDETKNETRDGTVRGPGIHPLKAYLHGKTRGLSQLELCDEFIPNGQSLDTFLTLQTITSSNDLP